MAEYRDLIHRSRPACASAVRASFSASNPLQNGTTGTLCSGAPGVSAREVKLEVLMAFSKIQYRGSYRWP